MLDFLFLCEGQTVIDRSQLCLQFYSDKFNVTVSAVERSLHGSCDCSQTAKRSNCYAYVANEDETEKDLGKYSSFSSFYAATEVHWSEVLANVTQGETGFLIYQPTPIAHSYELDDNDDAEEEALLQWVTQFAGIKRVIDYPTEAVDAVKSWFKFKSLNGRLRVCASDNFPLCTCAGEGLLPAVWRYFASEALAMTEGVEYEFTCLEPEDVVAAAVNATTANDSLKRGRCLVAVSGIPPTIDNMIRFGIPIYPNGKQIMVLQGQEASNLWEFLQVFTWDLWVLILVTCFLVAITVWLLESFALKRDPTRNIRKSIKCLIDSHWECFGLVVRTVQPTVTSLAARVFMFGFGTMVVVLLAVMTANITAFITSEYLKVPIGGWVDLYGKRVLWIGDGNKSGMSVRWQETDWQEPEFDEWDLNETLFEQLPPVAQALSGLRWGQYQAVVASSRMVDRLSVQNCDIQKKGAPIFIQPISLAFHADTPDAILRIMNYLMQDMQEKTSFITQISAQQLADNQCGSSNVPPRIGFMQMKWLWYVLAFFMGVGVVSAFVERCFFTKAARSESYSRSLFPDVPDMTPSPVAESRVPEADGTTVGTIPAVRTPRASHGTGGPPCSEPEVRSAFIVS